MRAASMFRTPTHAAAALIDQRVGMDMEGRENTPSAPDAGNGLSRAHWLERLSIAGSEPAVLAVCADYLAWIGPEAVAALPRECLPPSLETPSQLSTYALELVRHTLAARACGPLEQDLAEFFSSANARVAQLLRERERRPELVRLFAATSLQLAREIGERGR